MVTRPTTTQKSNKVSAPTKIRHLGLSLDLHIRRKTLRIANKAFSYRPEHLHLEGLLFRTRSANLAVTVPAKDSNVPDFVALLGVDAINRHTELTSTGVARATEVRPLKKPPQLIGRRYSVRITALLLLSFLKFLTKRTGLVRR